MLPRCDTRRPLHPTHHQHRRRRLPFGLTVAAMCVLLSNACASDPGEVTAESTAFGARFSHVQTHGIVDCTLTDGTDTTCFKLVFTQTNPTDDGPYCPANIDDIAGIGVYDGKTNPGLQLLTRKLWESMETDGYDIVDANGKVNVVTSLEGKPATGSGSCLALQKVNLTLSYLIPTKPKKRSKPATISRVEKIGVLLDGVPMTGPPPSVVSGPPGIGGPGGAIPSIDPCGGHPDPAGYYHAHFIPESINMVLEAYKITDVSCKRVKQEEHVLVGFAKDGFPVYSASKTKQPTDLDACNGKTGPTTEFPDGIYHYYAYNAKAPNMPPCLVGASVEDMMTYE